MSWSDDPVCRYAADGRRVDIRPSLQLVEPRDPDEDRLRVAELVRQAAVQPPLWDGYPQWPAPDIPMRVVPPGALAKGPARLLSRLRSADWAVVVTYARGATFDAQRRPGRVVGSFALRCSRGDQRAVAIWWEGRTDPARLEPQGVLVWGDRFAQWIGIQEFERGL